LHLRIHRPTQGRGHPGPGPAQFPHRHGRTLPPTPRRPLGGRHHHRLRHLPARGPPPPDEGGHPCPDRPRHRQRPPRPGPLPGHHHAGHPHPVAVPDRRTPRRGTRAARPGRGRGPAHRTRRRPDTPCRFGHQPVRAHRNHHLVHRRRHTPRKGHHHRPPD